ncbi:hypothetical protein Tco_1497475, partial [Tanacetum coccineum]
ELEKNKRSLKDCKIELERYKTFQTNHQDKEKAELKCNEILALLADTKRQCDDSLTRESYKTFLVKEENTKLVEQISKHETQLSLVLKSRGQQTKDFKIKEDKDMDKIIALENQVKFLNAQWEKLCLYIVQYDKNDLANLFVPQSDETIRLAEVSRSKMGDLVKPFNYTKLNNLYDLFVPQQQKSREQLYFSNDLKKNIFKTPFKKRPTIMVKNIEYLPKHKSKSKCKHASKDVKANVNNIRVIVDTDWQQRKLDWYKPITDDIRLLFEKLWK